MANRFAPSISASMPGAEALMAFTGTTKTMTGWPRSSKRMKLLSYYLPNFVLEGGSIAVDGEGTLITTEACLAFERP
jgi:hypothetical protein